MGFWTFAYSEGKNKHERDERYVVFHMSFEYDVVWHLHTVSTHPSNEKMQVDKWINPKDDACQMCNSEPTLLQATASNSALPVSYIVQTISTY